MSRLIAVPRRRELTMGRSRQTAVDLHRRSIRRELTMGRSRRTAVDHQGCSIRSVLAVCLGVLEVVVIAAAGRLRGVRP